MAGLTRLELATFRVTGGRSNQLSYSPVQMACHILRQTQEELRRRA